MSETEALSTVDYLKSIEGRFPEDILQLGLGMAYAEERKYVSVAVPEELKFGSLEILHLTDVQWGHVCCNQKKFIEHRDWLLSEPNRFALFGGDMIDAATLLSKGTPWENTGPPIEQIYSFCEVVASMRHRILGYVGGNHERHVRPTLGRSAGSFIASFLRIPYSEGQQFIRIQYGAWKPFKINLWHGGGSSQTKGAKAQVLHRFMLQGDAHLYLIGHLHDAMVLPGWRIKDNVKGRAIGLEKYYGAMSSSFIEFFGGYAEVKGLSASDTCMAKVTIWPDGKFRVTI